MKRLLIILSMSVLGGLVGYKIGHDVAKKKYESLADDEVASLKKRMNKLYGADETEIESPEEEFISERVDLFGKTVAPIRDEKGSSGKVDYGKQYRTGTSEDRIPGRPADVIAIEKDEIDLTKPHIISPEEFNDSNFEIKTLFYTADKVLTDDDYNQINNIGIVGGHPLLDQIGIYEADCIHIRDANKGIDYEVLVEEREFSKLNLL